MKAPIFIVGTGRSGTTILFKMLKDHPDVAWLSSLAESYPGRPYLNRLALRALGYPIFGKVLQKHLAPSEAYSYWDRVFPGFKMPCRDLLAEDVTLRVKKAFHKAVSSCLLPNRDRFLAKITGWPRIGFLQEIFPDAKFIHVIRDGRAVANSLLTVNFWLGWHGPQNWRWGDLPSKYYSLWGKHQKSFVALSAIQWIILEEAFAQALEKAKKESILDIKYEHLCANPIEVTKCIADFCGLHWSQKFISQLKQYKLRNANDKWKNELSEEQKTILQSVLSGHLEKLGYR